MTNSWALKASVNVPVGDGTGRALQIPPWPDPSPDFVLDDTEIKVEWDVAPERGLGSFHRRGVAGPAALSGATEYSRSL